MDSLDYDFIRTQLAWVEASPTRLHRLWRSMVAAWRCARVPNETERRERLALNMALRDWPKT